MKILITGANGFIGRYLCQKLSQTNEVIGTTRGDYSAEDPIISDFPNFRWHRADLSERLSLDEDIDIIVHAAARTPGQPAGTSEYVSCNVIATRNLIKLGIEKKVKLFVYLSGISIYGRIRSSVVDEKTPINEPDPYGLTKYVAELLLKEAEEVIPSITFRLPVVVGIGMKSGWIYKAYEMLLEGDPVHIYNGDTPYNMVHLSDVYDLVLRSLSFKCRGSSVFTASCTDFMSVRQIVSVMKQHTGSKSKIVEDVTPTVGFIICSEKAQRILGFNPKSAHEILNAFLAETSAPAPRAR